MLSFWFLEVCVRMFSERARVVHAKSMCVHVGVCVCVCVCA